MQIIEKITKEKISPEQKLKNKEMKKKQFEDWKKENPTIKRGSYSIFNTISAIRKNTIKLEEKKGRFNVEVTI